MNPSRPYKASAPLFVTSASKVTYRTSEQIKAETSHSQIIYHDDTVLDTLNYSRNKKYDQKLLSLLFYESEISVLDLQKTPGKIDEHEVSNLMKVVFIIKNYLFAFFIAIAMVFVPTVHTSTISPGACYLPLTQVSSNSATMASAEGTKSPSIFVSSYSTPLTSLSKEPYCYKCIAKNCILVAQSKMHS